MNQQERPLSRIVFSALFAALISAGAYIAIPVGPVPIVMQNMFILLAGLLLSPLSAVSAVGLYLVLGAIGLPVFAGGSGGFAHFFGPTGGYLISYLPAVLCAALIRIKLVQKTGESSRGRKIMAYVLALLAANAVIYLLGVSWLKIQTGMQWQAAIAAGMLPFLIGDALKSAAAALIALSVGQRIEEMIHG